MAQLASCQWYKCRLRHCFDCSVKFWRDIHNSNKYRISWHTQVRYPSDFRGMLFTCWQFWKPSTVAAMAQESQNARGEENRSHLIHPCRSNPKMVLTIALLLQRSSWTGPPSPWTATMSPTASTWTIALATCCRIISAAASLALFRQTQRRRSTVGVVC